MALEPLAGYPPLPLRARVSVSCTDPGPWPPARLFPSWIAAAGGGRRYESDVRARRGNRRAQGDDQGRGPVPGREAVDPHDRDPGVPDVLRGAPGDGPRAAPAGRHP